jgi:hypothetical protein
MYSVEETSSRRRTCEEQSPPFVAIWCPSWWRRWGRLTQSHWSRLLSPYNDERQNKAISNITNLSEENEKRGGRSFQHNVCVCVCAWVRAQWLWHLLSSPLLSIFFSSLVFCRTSINWETSFHLTYPQNRINSFSLSFVIRSTQTLN